MWYPFLRSVSHWFKEHKTADDCNKKIWEKKKTIMKTKWPSWFFFSLAILIYFHCTDDVLLVQGCIIAIQPRYSGCLKRLPPWFSMYLFQTVLDLGCTYFWARRMVGRNIAHRNPPWSLQDVDLYPFHLLIISVRRRWYCICVTY